MNRLQERASGEWSVQVYDGDRRLICSFYPSHGWSAAVGFLLGVLLTSFAVGCTQQMSPTEPSADIEPPMEAPLWLD